MSPFFVVVVLFLSSHRALCESCSDPRQHVGAPPAMTPPPLITKLARVAVQYCDEPLYPDADAPSV